MCDFTLQDQNIREYRVGITVKPLLTEPRYLPELIFSGAKYRVNVKLTQIAILFTVPFIYRAIFPSHEGHGKWWFDCFFTHNGNFWVQFWMNIMKVVGHFCGFITKLIL